MNINHINLILGFIAGLALGILLRSGTPTGREAKTLPADFRERKPA